MDYGRVASLIAIGIFFSVATVSGPLVQGIDLTESQGELPPPGSGSADVTIVSTPQDAMIVPKSLGDDAGYKLQVPEATARVENVTLRPILVYKIQIRELGHTQGTTLFLNASRTGTQTLTLETSQFEESRIREETYNGTLTVLLRSDAGEKILHQETIVVEVRE
ncbi:hypothetical protein [Haloglomus halophilum]|uniref:hypothetical protein n=1 Tax=Haloglomus halophilum TaxID=2962672 RepID=UPI0020C94ADF|nr:hypothetical protein [Haloglomus halophilum]